ncbi:tRNA (N6-threonylcarbamoyladenosine(37)-N6)-methyltransferase TrmO [Candidatus Harpocratesius sp.]
MEITRTKIISFLLDILLKNLLDFIIDLFLYIMIKMDIIFQPIGTIYTPYIEKAPYQPVTNDKGIFYIELQKAYLKGLQGLEKFRYIFVIFYIDRLNKKEYINTVQPPWVDNMEVGVFASRSPHRPNPIGLSIVKLKKIEDNRIYTSGLDVFNNTPLLDIKPYIQDLDAKSDANYGWLQFNNRDDKEHLLLHIKGVPH